MTKDLTLICAANSADTITLSDNKNPFEQEDGFIRLNINIIIERVIKNILYWIINLKLI